VAEVGVKTAAVRVAVAALVAYGAVFALLGVDTAFRVWLTRSAFDSPLDVAFIIVYEGMRVLTVGLAVVLALILGWRGARRPAAVLTSVLLVMLAVAFAKATAYSGFPGLVQERIARALVAREVPRGMLAFVFGQPAWALGLAAAAFLRLTVVYPAPITPDAVIAAGAHDRPGMLRGQTLAGTDVGALARRSSATALRAGLLRPGPVWTAAIALMLAHGIGLPLIVVAATLLAVGLPLLLGIPALRAGLATAGDHDRARILWFLVAALVAALSLVVGGILSAVPGGGLGWLAFLVLAIAPMVVLLCLTTAISPQVGVEPERALRFTVHWGTRAVIAVAVAALLEAALRPVLGAQPGARTAIALAVAGAAAVPVHAALRRRAARSGWWRLRMAAADR
jgi:hypothetical protein